MSPRALISAVVFGLAGWALVFALIAAAKAVVGAL